MRSLETIEKDLENNREKLKNLECTYAEEKKELCDDIFHDYRIFKWIECINELLSFTKEDIGLYRTVDVEMAYLFSCNGICCECDGDEKKIHFKKELD